MANKTPKGEVVAPPKTTAITQWQAGTPVPLDDKAKGNVKLLRIGDKTGRMDKVGNAILSKQMVVAPMSAKEIQEQNPGMTLVDARKASEDAGQVVKPAVMARVNYAGANKAFIVRRYAESRPGKRESMTLKLERVNVESTLEKFAREYKLTIDEVRQRLGIKDDAALTEHAA